MFKLIAKPAFTLRLSLAAFVFTLSGCGGVCGVSNGGNNSTLQSVNLQLDYIGTVPVLNGHATSSYFYVHNDGDSTINNISYTLGNAVSAATAKSKTALAASSDVVDDHGFVLNGSSLNNCASIAPHGYCKIEFTTPALTLGNQNNSLLKISVTDGNGFNHAFDQVINYSYYNVELNSGVNFATSADVVANITNKRYMMGYLVGGGSGQTFNNVTLQITNSGAIQINQGFVNGQSIASAEVVPVEFNVNILTEQPTPVNVSPLYVLNSTQGTRLASLRSPQTTHVVAGQSLYVNASSLTSSAMALKVGVVPIIPAPSTETNAPTIYVSNFGDNISGFTIEPASTNVKVYANNCSGTIESNSSCSFKLGTDATRSGSSDILFKVNGQTIASKVVYYAPITPVSTEAVLINTTPINQIILNPNQSSSVVNLVFSNLGNYPLTNLAFTPKNSGSGTTQLKIISNSCDPRIESQTQCVVQVQAIGGAAGETGGVYLDVSGKLATSSFTTQSGIINYSITTGSQLIISSPLGAESTLSILGDNLESAQTTFTLQNSGSTSIAIKSVSLAGMDVPSALVIAANNCGNNLVANATCNVTVKYGPAQPESNLSGIANLQVNYGESNNTLTGTINYSVMALDSHLKITSVIVSGFSGGGTQASPYSGSGCNANPLTMTITYKNMSDNYVAQNMALNIIDGHLSPYLSVDTSATTCGYGATPKNLGIGQSCNLMLIANRSSMTDNASFNLNVNYPSASWNTTQGFVSQDNFTYNGSTTIYANYTQPVLTSSIDPTSGLSYTRTLTQVLTGAAGCGDLQTSIMATNVTAATVTNGNCTVNGSDYSVSCTNNSTNSTNTIVYTIDNSIPTPSNPFMRFARQTSGKQLWFNPNILIYQVGN